FVGRVLAATCTLNSNSMLRSARNMRADSLPLLSSVGQRADRLDRDRARSFLAWDAACPFLRYNGGGMEINIRPIQHQADSQGDAPAVRVELDLLDGHKLASDPLPPDEAERLRAELHR